MNLKKVASINTKSIKNIVFKDVLVNLTDGTINGNINLNLI